MQYFTESDNAKKIVRPLLCLDSENCATYSKFFKTFYDVTLRFSATLYVTATAYVHGRLIKETNQMERTKDSLLHYMAVNMKAKFESRESMFTDKIELD